MTAQPPDPAPREGGTFDQSYKQARGIIPPRPGLPAPEETIRQARNGEDSLEQAIAECERTIGTNWRLERWPMATDNGFAINYRMTMRDPRDERLYLKADGRTPLIAFRAAMARATEPPSPADAGDGGAG